MGDNGNMFRRLELLKIITIEQSPIFIHTIIRTHKYRTIDTIYSRSSGIFDVTCIGPKSRITGIFDS